MFQGTLYENPFIAMTQQDYKRSNAKENQPGVYGKFGQSGHL